RVVQDPSAARRASRRRLEPLHAAFELIQPLVGLLRGLVGGFRTLGRALHPRVKLVEARVDACELVVVRGATGKTHADEHRKAKRTGRLQMILGREHSDLLASGQPDYSGLLSGSGAWLQAVLDYV